MRTTLSVSVPTGMLGAALLFSADKDPTRPYLCGVCVEHSRAGVRLYATDGHCLIACNVPLSDDVAPYTSENPTRYLLPNDAVNAITKAYRKQPVIPVCFEHEWEPAESAGVREVRDVSKRVVLGNLELGQTVVPVPPDAYPDVARVVPRATSGVLAQFNAAYLLDCAKARALLNDSKVNGFVRVHHNGDAAAFVPLTADAFAVIMPVRGDVQDGTGAPAWFTGETEAAAEAA